MKKVLVAGVLLGMSLGATTSFATPIQLDLNAAGIAASTFDTNVTGAFDQLQVYAETTSKTSTATGLPTVGAAFTDIGDLYVTALLTTSNSQYLNAKPVTGLINGWELTGRWTNLGGTIAGQAVDVAGNVTFNYDYKVGTLNLYAQQGAEVANNKVAAFGTSVGSSDDTASKFTNGTPVATLELLKGAGTLTYNTDGTIEGGTNLRWKFVSGLSNFWQDAFGNDLAPYINMGWSIATNDSNTDKVQTFYNEDRQVLTIDSNHDGSVEVVVPEPSTFLLLGGGLLGFAALGRRRFKKQ